MVIVNLEVPFAGNFKIKQPVTRKEFEHMIEKRQPGAHLRLSVTVKVEDDAHVCLFRLSVDFRGALMRPYLSAHKPPRHLVELITLGESLNQPAEQVKA